jgi:uncharacterized protein (TIGR03435 family)
MEKENCIMSPVTKAILACVVLLASRTGRSQPSTLSFEVADIKPSAGSNSLKRKPQLLPGGRLEVPDATLKDLVGMAYGVRDAMIIGGPEWADHQHFDVLAKASSDAAMPALRQMMQALLAERFKLVIHPEDRAMRAYALTVGKREPRYREGAGGRQTCDWKTGEGGLRRRECRNITMLELANQLPGWAGIGIDLPVVDQTGLKGSFDFELEVGMTTATVPGGAGENAPVDSGPTIFQALDQIGLKLESRKTDLPVIVIDHAESPTAK